MICKNLRCLTIFFVGVFTEGNHDDCSGTHEDNVELKLYDELSVLESYFPI